ncbi:sensor histidine kinase [Actinokineospora sp. G85]|uniref:sensor histidine kinase n=1 Tax=Actinokineospora sp. G85 TaxID=3406626 RepID=UPI003C751417
MRARERDSRAVAAVADCLAAQATAGGPWPDLVGIAGAVLHAAELTGCWLTVGGRRAGQGLDRDPWTATVAYGGEAQGVLAITPASAGPLPELARALGPVLAAARLTAETDDLRRVGDVAARELADGRWRAAAEMDRERRGLERDLHDGAQHHLVALRMAVGLLEHTLAAQGAGAARDRLDDLLARLGAAEELVLRTASGILPLVLVSDGLAAALAAHLAEHDDVCVDVDGELRRYPAAVESAVYFVCMEAVNNAHKHAVGASIWVRVRDSLRGLEFEVRDDGRGFDPGALPADAGLHNLNTRAGAVGGWVRVSSEVGVGTVVTGFVPAAG